jgi:hypothetical protein
MVGCPVSLVPKVSSSRLRGRFENRNVTMQFETIPDGFKIQSRGCMVTIENALREDWPMSDECRARLDGTTAEHCGER